MFESYVAPAAAMCAAVLFSMLLWTSAAVAQSSVPRARHSDGAIVERGDAGGTVAKVQRALQIDADGIFGKATVRAVKDFQASVQLPRTGKVDRPTWRALFRAPVSSAGSGGDPAESGGAPPVAPDPAPVAPDPAPAEPAPATPGPAAPGACANKLAAPLHGTKTSGFGDGRNHAGIDLAAPIGTAVRAAACGTVNSAGTQSGYGTIICIRHSTAFVTCYAHLSSMAVSKGTVVTRGQVIGRVGMTGRTSGPHLHFETRVDGKARDPEPYLAGTKPVPGTAPATARARAR
ncbi:MAG: hypothetical protein QOJ46_2795 [bacterium]